MNLFFAIKQLKFNLSGTVTVITKCPYYMKTQLWSYVLSRSKCGAVDATARLLHSCS